MSSDPDRQSPEKKRERYRLQNVIERAVILCEGETLSPEEIAEGILFLASEKATSITGATLPADGVPATEPQQKQPRRSR